MRVIKVAILAFVLSCVIFSGPAEGVEITPIIVSMPDLPGELFSFDFVISDPMGLSAQVFQATISVSGPEVLTFDTTESEAVANATGYWVFGNSLEAVAMDLGNNSYSFDDGPSNAVAEPLATEDIMARYAFTWDGTVGDYTFTLDLDINKSFIQDESFTKQALQFSSGQYPGDSDYFTVHIPEPTTLILIGLGGLVLLRKRRAQS